MKNLFNLLIVIILYACDHSSDPVEGRILSGGYYCRSVLGTYLSDDRKLKPHLYGDVIRVNSDSCFIIAKQHPNFENHKAMLAFHLKIYRLYLINYDSLSNDTSDILFNKFVKENTKLIPILLSKLSAENNEHDLMVSQILADSILKNDPFYKSVFKNYINYWIIVHSDSGPKQKTKLSTFYGPFTKLEYIKKRKALRVPEILRIDED